MELGRKSISQLIELKLFLGQLKKDQYTQQLPDLSQATLGQHVRHIIEFYQCLLKASSSEGLVCYDRRNRDPKLENEIPSALTAINEIILGIKGLKGDFPLILVSIIENDEENSVSSTLFREFWYVYEHTTHHMAILKIGGFLLGIKKIPSHFGVADSTIAFRNLQVLTKET